jgi:hypothetical protein
MITDSQLISKLQQLKTIEPSPNWVSFAKKRILGEEEKKQSWLASLMFFNLKPAYLALGILFILFGLFGVSRSSLPGDFFYPVKKIAEKGQAIFVSEQQKTEFSLNSVSKRLEEVNKIAQTNQMGKLAPAIEEYQASVAQAAKDLASTAATTSDPMVIKKLAEQTQKLEENKVKLEKTFGIAGLETKEGSNPIKILAEWLLKDTEKRTLTDEQSSILNEAKKDYESGDFNAALTNLLSLSYPQD